MKNYIVPIFVVIFLILRDLFDILIPMELFLIVISFIFLFINTEEIISIVAFLIPFENSILVSFLFISGTIVIIFKKKFKLDKIFLFLIFFILLWEIIHINNGYFLVNSYIKFGAALLFFLVVYSLRETISFKEISKSFIYGLCIFIILVLINQFIFEGFSVNDVTNNFSRLGDFNPNTYGYGLYNNPNAIGVSLNVAIGLLISFKENEKNNIIYILMFLFFIFSGFITQSKTFLIVFTFQVIYFFVCKKEDLIKKINQIVIFSIGFIIVFILLDYIFPSLIEEIIIRFRPEYIFSSRDTIFNDYNSFIFSNSNNLFIGVGIQNINLKALFFSNPHNMIQEVFVAWGIIGLIWLMFLIIKVFSDGFKKREKQLNRKFLMDMLPLLSFLIATQLSRVFSKPEFIILLLISIGGFYKKNYIEGKMR